MKRVQRAPKKEKKGSSSKEVPLVQMAFAAKLQGWTWCGWVGWLAINKVKLKESSRRGPCLCCRPTDPPHGGFSATVERFNQRKEALKKADRWKNILGCPRRLGSMVRINGLFHLLINRVYWGYNPLTNLLLTSWDIQVGVVFNRDDPQSIWGKGLENSRFHLKNQGKTLSKCTFQVIQSDLFIPKHWRKGSLKLNHPKKVTLNCQVHIPEKS